MREPLSANPEFGRLFRLSHGRAFRDRCDALPYRKVDVKRFYPYGVEEFAIKETS